MSAAFWLIQKRRDHDRYAVSETRWDIEAAQHRVKEILENPAGLRWLRLVEYHSDSPATVIVDWRP